MQLGAVTAVCVDTRDLNLALLAAERMAAAGVGRVVLITDEAGAAYVAPRNAWGVEIVRSPTLADMDAYNDLILKDLGRLAPAEFLLVFQWDGFILNAADWWPGYLDYDFIGAPWPEYMASPQSVVGNGGFSLRSRRLIEAVWTLPPRPPNFPEDRFIVDNLPLLASQGVKIAPPEIARHFSVEHHPPHPMAHPERLATRVSTFGFHGWFNMYMGLSDAALLRLIDEVMTAAQRERILISSETTWLVAYMLAAGRKAGVAEIADRIERVLGSALDRADPLYLQNVIDLIVKRRGLTRHYPDQSPAEPVA